MSMILQLEAVALDLCTKKIIHFKYLPVYLESKWEMNILAPGYVSLYEH